MRNFLALTLVGGVATGMALTWLWPTGNPSPGPSKSTGKNAATRPGNLSSPSSSPLVKAWREATAHQGGFGQHIGLMAMVMQATSEEMPLLLAQSGDNSFARELLILRWVEIDAAAAGEWISPALRNPNPLDQTTRRDVRRVLTAWAKRDPDAALAKVKAEASPNTVSTYQNQILTSALSSDMERGLKLLSAIKGEANSMLGDTAWVAKDPAKAARLLSEMPESDFRNDALARAIGEVGGKDLAAGRALLEQFPGLSSPRQQYYGAVDSRASFFEQWAKKDMTAMIGFANDHAQGPTRLAMKEAIAKVIGEGDPKVAFAWAADNLSGQRHHNVVSSLLTKLAKEKPAEALDYLASLPPGSALSNAVDTFARASIQEDPVSAVARAQSLPEGPARTQLMTSTYLAWYGKDPATALAEITSQPPGSLPGHFFNSLGHYSRSIDTGLKQLDKIPAEHAPDFIRGVFSTSSSNSADISQAARGLGQLKEPAQRMAAIETVTNTWSYRDPTAVAEWAAKLPNADERLHVHTLLERRIGQFAPEQRERLLAPLNR